MNDELLAGYIYEILQEKELSLNDIRKILKNHQVEIDQIQCCLRLLHNQRLVCVKKKDGVDKWSLSSETDETVSESGDQIGAVFPSGQTSCGGRSSRGQTSSVDNSPPGHAPASYVDRGSSGGGSVGDKYSKSSSNNDFRGSYAEATKSRFRDSTSHSSASTSQPRGADAIWLLPSKATEPKPECTQTKLVTKNGDSAARGRRNERPPSRDSPTLPSNQSPTDSRGDTTRSRNRPNQGLSSTSDTSPTNTSQTRGVYSACPQPSNTAEDRVVAVRTNPVDAITRSVGNMELVTRGDTKVAEYNSLKPEVQQCKDTFSKILSVLTHAGKPLKAAEIAKMACVGDSKKSVNSPLYFLEKQSIVKKSMEGSCPLWSLTCEKPIDELSRETAIKYYNGRNPGSDTSIATKSDNPDSDSPPGGKCPTCNGTCVHNTHVNNHYYNIQVGNINMMNVNNPDNDLRRVEDE